MKKIRAYWCHLPDFSNVKYDEYLCVEEEGTKTILFSDNNMEKFIEENRFQVVETDTSEGLKVLLIRYGMIYGQIIC